MSYKRDCRKAINAADTLNRMIAHAKIDGYEIIVEQEEPGGHVQVYYPIPGTGTFPSLKKKGPE